MELKSVSKKAILNMLLTAALVAVIISTAAVLLFLGVLRLEITFSWFNILYFACLSAVDVILLVSPFVRYGRYKYSIDDLRIVKKEGIFFVSTEMAPIERVHQITVNRGPIDNLTGLAKVTVTTAGGEITIRFLETREAFRLAESLEGSIKAIVREQAEKNEK